MTLHNEDVAAAFDEMADLLAIQGENTFRIRAYRRAAQVVRTLPRELAEMDGAKAFDALPGIGADLAGKIAELIETGNIHALGKLRKQVPKGLRELLALPGLGPVRVRALYTGLDVRGVEDLRREFDTQVLVPEQGEQIALEQVRATREPSMAHAD
jgi:DNA polymerase (family 10)